MISVARQTHADLGPDPVAEQAVAANARLAMTAGGSYLIAHLDAATLAELASAIRSFADDLNTIGNNALAATMIRRRPLGCATEKRSAAASPTSASERLASARAMPG